MRTRPYERIRVQSRQMCRLRDACRFLLWLLPLVHATCLAQAESAAELLSVGQWLEVRGSYGANGSFLAARVELLQPGRYETLIGTIRGSHDAGPFTLLGQRVQLHEKTTFGGLDRSALEGTRVKVEGYYHNEERFSAREISSRGEGRDRITGRIDDIALVQTRSISGLEVGIMGYRVLIPEELQVRHDLTVAHYEFSQPRAQSIVNRNRDEDDLFGKGMWITDKLLLVGQLQARASKELEFDLDEADPENRTDFASAFRARFVYQPTPSFIAVAELNHRQLWRIDDEDGRLSRGVTKLGETYLYWIDPFGIGLDLQIGRVDFDDRREWLYDQNLDTLRAIWTGKYVRADLSYSETLSDGSPFDEAAATSMLYVSNNDYDRHLAAYVIYRDIDLEVPLRRTHFGLRAFGAWLPEQESWVEVAYMLGKREQLNSRGWAFDIGSSWWFHERFSITLGYAVGQGDDPESTTDETFRQSGLQDNNDKFSGVTSFRYYGELVDPELANLEILTAGLGWLPMQGISVDLIGHSYWQNKRSDRLVDSDIDMRPNGIYRYLGWEIDLVLGWRTSPRWDLEAVTAWFNPGNAFDQADNAALGKFQFRYKF